jgi:hypothetical protein
MMMREMTGRDNTRVVNDCTVRAFAVAAGVSYPLAASLMARAGRTPKRGLPITQWLPVFQRYGLCLDDDRLPTLDAVRGQFPDDNYIAWFPKHIAAVRGGESSDWWEIPRGTTAYGLWRIPNVASPALETLRTLDNLTNKKA